MILGIDASTYLEELAHGAKYFIGDTQIDPLDEFILNGVSVMRIRVWVDPKNEKGEPYLAGNCDIENFVSLAKLCLKKGYAIMLDLHYSDFWADPGKQIIPKSWKEREIDALCERVYQYTLEVLERAEKENIPLAYIQVGNEITNGMLWPVGKLVEKEDGTRGNYKNLVKLLSFGIKAVREKTPKSKIVIHLEKSYDQKIYNEFFDHMKDANLDYDIIGMSYYPYWHGTQDEYFANVDNLKRYGKKIMTVELGYAFTLEDYIKNVGVGGAKLVINVDNIDSLDFTAKYPITPEGQAEFVKDFLLNAREHEIDGVFWWEPLWIPGEGICWASDSAKDYIGESHKTSCRNEWANQCLFDYEGIALPAFWRYKK